MKEKIMSEQSNNQREYDGIICVGGEDWWYHNRGHFDFQIMRRMAKDRPVLFINSLGVRMPSLSDKSLFMKRITRKLKSLKRGIVNVENNFWVFSPLNIPGKTGRTISEQTLAPQIKLAARYAGIKKPLLWMHCPAGAHLVKSLAPVATVMQRTDRFEAFTEITDDSVSKAVAELKSDADLVVYCNEELRREEEADVKSSCLITHGVDYERFSNAAISSNEISSSEHSANAHLQVNRPKEMQHINGPLIGFIGGIDHHSFDPDLFLQTAQRLPNCQFILVGNCSLEQDWCTLPNVHLLGQKPYDQVADYMAACDTLIMPWNKSDWINACNPIKLKEYLATGRPVVSRDIPALAPYRDLVRTAEDADTFASAIADSLLYPGDPKQAQMAVKDETWEAKVEQLNTHLLEIGIKFASAHIATPQIAEHGKLDDLSRAT